MKRAQVEIDFSVPFDFNLVTEFFASEFDSWRLEKSDSRCSDRFFQRSEYGIIKYKYVAGTREVDTVVFIAEPHLMRRLVDEWEYVLLGNIYSRMIKKVKYDGILALGHAIAVIALETRDAITTEEMYTQVIPDHGIKTNKNYTYSMMGLCRE